MSAQSLSGSWSAQVPERPAAVGSRLEYPRGCRGVDLCGPSRLITRSRRIGQIVAPLRPFAFFFFAGGLAAGRPLRTSLTLRRFASKSPAAAYTRRFVSTLRGRGSGRSIRPLGVYIRSLGLVSWLVGGAYAPTGDVYPFIGSGFVVCWGCICPWWGVHMLTGSAYPSIGGVFPSTGGVYPFIGSGFVVWWGCISFHCGCPSTWGVYICSLGVVSWRVGGALWSRHVIRQWPH